MKRALLLVLSLTSAAHAGEESLVDTDLHKVTPEPGVAAVGKFKPTWCAGRGGDGVSPRALGLATESDLWGGAEKAARFACADPDDGLFQQQVGYYMQRWVNLGGQSPAEVAELLTLRADGERWEKLADETCAKTAAADEASFRDKVLAAAAADVLGCSYGHPDVPSVLSASTHLDGDWIWEIDRAAAPPSQLAAIARVLRCEWLNEADDLHTLVSFAACRHEVALLDDKALTAELQAAGHNDQARLMAQFSLAVVRRRAALLDKAVAARAAADEDMKSILIDAPERAWKEWSQSYQAHRADYDASYAYEDRRNSGRTSAAKGCLEGAQRDLDAFYAGLKGDTLDGLLTAATTPRGMMLLGRMAACDEAEGRPGAASAYALIMSYGHPGRGPRTAVYMAMEEAAARVLAERQRFPITAEMMSFRVGGPEPQGRADVRGVHDRLADSRGGIVVKVDKKGERVFVTFKTEKWKEPEVSCVDTNRVNMFRPDGSIIYQQKCTATGNMITREQTAEPFWTWAPLAAGLAPGQFVTYTAQAPGGDTRVDGVFEGFPYQVWKDKERKALVAVLGILAR